MDNFTYAPVSDPPIGAPGDYDNTGVVDAADYTLYRDALDTDTLLPNDTTPGSVTQVDFEVWETNFGASLAASTAAAVPEPAAMVLIVLGALALKYDA